MKSGGRARRHGVFVRTEGFEATIDEVVQPLACLLPRGRPVELAGFSRMVREAGFDQCYYVPDVWTAFRPADVRNRHRFWQFLAIVGIETPLASARLAGRVKQEVEVPALLLVKIAH